MDCNGRLNFGRRKKYIYLDDNENVNDNWNEDGLENILVTMKLSTILDFYQFENIFCSLK